jgi:uncharacterized membrane protein YvbJ
MFCQKCGIENSDNAMFCNACGGQLVPNSRPSTQTLQIKEIKAKIAEKKAELAGISNGGAWVFLIIGLLTAIFLIGIVLIIIALVIMHNNQKNIEKLTKEIAELENQLT